MTFTPNRIVEAETDSARVAPQSAPAERTVIVTEKPYYADVAFGTSISPRGRDKNAVATYPEVAELVPHSVIPGPATFYAEQARGGYYREPPGVAETMRARLGRTSPRNKNHER